MSNSTVTLLKWIFMSIGIVFAAAALVASGEARLPMALISLAFGGIGIGIVAHRWWSEQRAADLKQNGRLVQAEFKRVELNESLEVNGANPFRIAAQWHDTKSHEVFVFRSANLWYDPSDYVHSGQNIPVYVDPRKPSRYHMDLSFLPKVRNT